jgi:hypothetical protein
VIDMLDLIFLAGIIGFFLIALGYVAACGWLRKGAKSE